MSQLLCRARNAAAGKRTKAVPEAVSNMLGQGNLLYATEKCVLPPGTPS